MFAGSTFIAAALGCTSEPPAAPSATVAADSSAADNTLSLASAAITGVPFGPYNIMNSYTTWAWGPAPFTVSLNGNTGAGGVIQQIQSVRNKGQKLMLSLTDGRRSYQITNGKYDMAKWKARMDAYNTTAIKAEVARGLADGTIIGNATINEPKNAEWGGVVNKAVMDEQCAYVKKIFPGLPTGPITVHWWLREQTFRVCDFIVDQYTWDQPPLGWGTPNGKGNVTGWRDAALAQAKKEGITIAFSMNVLDGGIMGSTCPLGTTGGAGTYAGHCKMTASQVRDFGRALGPSGCAMFMWMYNGTFMSNSANIQAFKDVAATLATVPGRSCARGSSGGSTPPPPPPPPPPGTPTSIALAATGRIEGAVHYMSLKWSGAKGTMVDIYRNGALLRKTANDGSDTNGRTHQGAATYTFKVCEAGSTTCSTTVTVTAGTSTSPPPPPPPPPPPASTTIPLTATGRTQGSAQYMSLKWSGARGTSVDIHRNGALLRRTANDGSDTNGRTYQGAATYAFKVCEAGSTTCSAVVTVRF